VNVLVAVVDGLKGFPDAITAVFPQATVQTCIVHLLRLSLDFVSYKDRKPVAAALKDIYRAVDAAAAEAALIAFDEGGAAVEWQLLMHRVQAWTDRAKPSGDQLAGKFAAITMGIVPKQPVRELPRLLLRVVRMPQRPELV
jgi:hypothetical protein